MSCTTVEIILDMSGSMSSMGNEPVDAVNMFIRDQASVKVSNNAKISLTTFNTEAHPVFVNQPINEEVVFQSDQYEPLGMTALYDTLGEMLSRRLKEGTLLNTFVIIVTDGEDNSSQQWKKTDVEELVNTAKTEYGCEFMFIGANIDSYKEGGDIGINNAYQFNQSMEGALTGCIRMASGTATQYRSTRSNPQ